MAKNNDFRDEAARRLNEQKQEIIATLLALTKTEGGTRSDYLDVTCKHCRRDGRYPYIYPVAASDPQVVIKAIEALDKMGFGRPGDNTEETTIDLDKDPAKYTPAERAALMQWAINLGAPEPKKPKQPES